MPADKAIMYSVDKPGVDVLLDDGLVDVVDVDVSLDSVDSGVVTCVYSVECSVEIVGSVVFSVGASDVTSVEVNPNGSFPMQKS
jgi:hypothetical protein